MANNENRFTRDEILCEKFTINSKEWAVMFAKGIAEEYDLGYTIVSRYDTPECIVTFSAEQDNE